MCCDRTCGGSCEACKGLGADGTCTPSPLVKGADVAVPNTDQSLGLRVLWADTQYALSWTQGTGAGSTQQFRVYLGLLSSPGVITAVTSVLLTQPPAAPAAAWNGTEFLLSWSTPTAVQAQRITSGGLQTGSPLLQQSAASGLALYDLTWNGARSQYGLLSSSSAGLNALRADQLGGAVPGSNPLTMATSYAGAPAIVATQQGSYGAIWASGGTVYLALLDATGAKVGTEATVGSGYSRRIAWSGSEFGIPYTTSGGGLRFARFGSDGTRRGSDVALASQAASESWVTWAADRWLVVWAQGMPEEIYAQFVSSDGTPLGGASRLTSTPTASNFPTVAFDGRDFGFTRYEFTEPPPPAAWTWSAYFSKLSCQ